MHRRPADAYLHPGLAPPRHCGERPCESGSTASEPSLSVSSPQTRRRSCAAVTGLAQPPRIALSATGIRGSSRLAGEGFEPSKLRDGPQSAARRCTSRGDSRVGRGPNVGLDQGVIARDAARTPTEKCLPARMRMPESGRSNIAGQVGADSFVRQPTLFERPRSAFGRACTPPARRPGQDDSTSRLGASP